jgi:2-oxoglutarate ferredoxin oxidoreductase subunit delta
MIYPTNGCPAVKGEEFMALVEFLEDRCKGCELCVHVCPKGIVKLKTDRLNAKGFHPAGVDDMEKCIGCAFCAMICPDNIIEVDK